MAKGLAIIEALSMHGVQSAAEAARASNSTRAAARRCLLTLVELGYVERIGREFRPLPRLRNLGRRSDLRSVLVEQSGPVLERGRNELNESVSLAVLEGGDVLFIARAEAAHIISTGVRVGARLPAYCSATGRVLLSQLDAEELVTLLGKKPLPTRTANTITKPALLAREIEAIRTAKFALSDEELEVGMRSLAVPMRDPSDTIVAAISVSAYSARVSRDRFLGHFLSVLQALASELEERCYGKRA